jgi:hypothetical protein
VGLEVTCACRWPGGAGEVTALLESRELILRGALRRRLAISALSLIRVEGEALYLETGGETIALDLGAARATLWQRKLTTPPPSLAAKLGIGPETKAWVIGAVTDPTLAAALHGATADDPASARSSLAVVTSDAELSAALEAHSALPPGAPIWIVYGKGRQAVLGETAVRGSMRAHGYIDSKVSAVSETLSATRFVRRG